MRSAPSTAARTGAALALWAALGTTAAGCTSLIAQLPDEQAEAVARGPLGVFVANRTPVSDEEERSWGGAIATGVVQRNGGLVKGGPFVEYVELIGHTLAMHCDRPELKWHFGVLRNARVNAVSAPGGYIFVTLGAMGAAKDESELAGVIAHEIGHVVARHAVAVIKDMKTKQRVVGSATEEDKKSGSFAALMDGYLSDYLTNGLPRDTEYEADAIGTELLRRAGYDPDGLRRFLARLNTGGDKLMSTHPASDERVAKLEAQLKAMGDVTGKRLAERRNAVARGVAPVPKLPPPPDAPPPPAKPDAKSDDAKPDAKPAAKTDAAKPGST